MLGKMQNSDLMKTRVKLRPTNAKIQLLFDSAKLKNKEQHVRITCTIDVHTSIFWFSTARQLQDDKCHINRINCPMAQQDVKIMNSMWEWHVAFICTQVFFGWATSVIRSFHETKELASTARLQSGWQRSWHAWHEDKTWWCCLFNLTNHHFCINKFWIELRSFSMTFIIASSIMPSNV